MHLQLHLLLRLLQSKSILELTGKRLASTDPYLLTIDNLNSLSSITKDISLKIDQFTAQVNDVFISQANDSLDILLGYLAKIPQIIPTNDIDIINESLSNYRSNLDRIIKKAFNSESSLNTKIDLINASLDKQEAKLNEEQIRLATVLTEYQTLFSASQDLRASEYSTVTSEYNKQFSAMVIESQQTFAKLLSDLTQSLNESKIALTNQLENTEKTAKASLARLRNEYENKAKNVLNDIELKLIEVEKLVGVIGNLGVTSGYLKEANAARVRAFFWQGLTVTALGGLIWVAYLMAFPPEVNLIKGVLKDMLGQPIAVNVENAKLALSAVIRPESSTSLFYQALATRVFLSITFGIFAAYSGTQAEKYMEIDKRNRKLALELAAVGAFIAPLPVDMQNKFRADLGEKSFGVMESGKVDLKDPVSLLDVLKSKDFEEIVKRLFEVVKSNK